MIGINGNPYNDRFYHLTGPSGYVSRKMSEKEALFELDRCLASAKNMRLTCRIQLWLNDKLVETYDIRDGSAEWLDCKPIHH